MDQQSSNSLKLGVVDVETHLDVHYAFPDMDLGELEKVLPEGSNRILSGQTDLILVNVSGAVLSVPFRIVRKIVAVEGAVNRTWWEFPV